MSSVVLSNVSWSTPDNFLLFEEIDVTFGPERTGLVGRNGIGKTSLLRLIAGQIEPTSGTISVPGPIGFLRQTPEVRAGDTIADLFGVEQKVALLRRAERGEASANDLESADWTLEDRMERALVRVGLNAIAPCTLLDALSGGQRTRAGLAALFFTEPDVLLLDEPTDHLDREGRVQVLEALLTWRGAVIVASHDRALLSEMDAIVELTGLGARRYGGNYGSYRAQKAAELATAHHDRNRAERTLAEVERRAQEATERKARTDRQGRALRASGGQPKMVFDAAKQRSENSGGASAHLRTKRATTARYELEEARERIEVLEPIHMDVPSSGLFEGKTVLDIDGLGFGYSPDRPVLQDVSLNIRGPERVAIKGANGAGKSTLLSCIMGDLTPQMGTISVHVPIARIDQEVRILDPDQSIRENFVRLDPQASENERRAALARFLFRAEAAEQIVGTLSGGQRIRAGLACVLGRSEPPQLLLLDEPSNHLDIEATEALEAALGGYDGALLVVSHDSSFLDSIRVDRSIKL